MRDQRATYWGRFKGTEGNMGQQRKTLWLRNGEILIPGIYSTGNLLFQIGKEHWEFKHRGKNQ